MPLDTDSIKAIRSQQAAYAREVKAIQADTNLSAAGKGRALAVLRNNAQTVLNQINANAQSTYVTRKAELERKLFSVADQKDDVAASISFRDAMDRVAELKTGSEGQLMMRRAVRTGDKLLARALFDRAWEVSGDQMAGAGWGEVIKAYIGDVRPDLEPAVEELSTLQQVDNRATRMNDQMELSLFMPPELASMSHYDRQQAIAQATPSAPAGVEALTPGAGTPPAPATPAAVFSQWATDSANGVHGA